MADDDQYIKSGSEVRNFGYHLGKADNELFDDSKYVPGDVLQITYKTSKKNGEEWQIIKNKKVFFTILHSFLSKKDAAYLKTSDGICNILAWVKEGVSSQEEIKKKLKKLSS
jgi:hypothetical protein